MSGAPTKVGKSLPAAAQVRQWAVESGFREAVLLALPHAGESREAERMEAWLEAGAHGSMQYLERRDEAGERLRARVGAGFAWARSAIVCLASYNWPQPRSIDPAPEGAGWIARYAWSGRRDRDGAERPSDYHKVLKRRLEALDQRLHAELGGFESRAFVDTGPLLERSLAAAAGLGWIGKNTCLISQKLGSWSFLAVLLTALPVQETEPRAGLVPDRCGSCRRCLDACPTGALTGARQMDARRCIAYLTIEHRGAIDPELQQAMGRHIFGCDICQDVCPWNRKAPISEDCEMRPRELLVNPSLEALARLGEQEFERMFNGSPVRRTGFTGFRRNLAVAMGNSGNTGFRERLAEWAQAADEGLRQAAGRALGSLGKQQFR